MQLRSWLAAALVLLVTLGAASASFASSRQAEGVRALDGEWLYVEDRTEGRAVEEQQPSMSAKFALRVEEAAVVVVRRDFEVRLPLDGTGVEVTREGRLSRYSGSWKDGAFTYDIEMLNPADKSRTGVIRTELRPTAEGLLARVEVESQTSFKSLALYRHPKDIALPTPAKATIADLAWLAGNWVGTRGSSGTTSIEERWSPPLGGAMLATSRTVSKGKLSAFEYLRVVERDGGLVYIAQPGGNPPTEFVLTELTPSRAVFENPHHDSPQRIVYELSGDSLSASIGFMRGGRPQRFEFKREAS